MDVYIHSCWVSRGSRGSCKWQSFTLWGSIPVALPLCHGHHHSHRLIMEWSTMRAILMSRFIRATKHAELWCHRLFFFSFSCFIFSYPLTTTHYSISLSPHYVCLFLSFPIGSHLIFFSFYSVVLLQCQKFSLWNCFYDTKNIYIKIWPHQAMCCSVDLDNFLKRLFTRGHYIALSLLDEMFPYFAHDTNLSIRLRDMKFTFRHGYRFKVFSCRDDLIPLFHFKNQY